MGEQDPLPQLPLALHPPHLIPPAPTPDHRALSFLPDFGGLPWVAYAAGSLLVVSHLPSPPRTSGSDTVEDESPFFCQVIDLHTPVSAVAWCGRGRGELAAASGNSVSVFQPAPSSGSFSWLLRWVITETFTVTAIAWTGSGDGIVVVGGGVAMWARVQSSWQLAWRSTPQVPQSLVSATHFVHAPVVAASAAASVEGNVPVLVFLNDAKLGLETVELLHPQPVSMIQWRPLTLSVGDPSEVRREILMTCCLDGTARLWTGAEVTRSKKQPTSRRSFSIIAVIELDNILNGVLGVDISVRWAVETGSVVSRDEEAKFKLFSGHSWQNKVGRCEWLVSVGPGRCTNFWAAHCLDDVSPPRYPRITLWKQSEPQAWEESAINPKSTVQPIFVETVISRIFHDNRFLVLGGENGADLVVVRISNDDQGRHVTYVHGEMFAAAIYEGSTVFPTVVDGEYPTCISVMSLDNTVLPLQQHVPFATSPGYHIATGYSDGTVKLWKMSGADNPLQTGRGSNSWELVGMFGAHPGPISAISLSRCGRVATVGRNVQKNSTSIHIWEAVKLMGDGCFLLEDALMIQSAVVGLDWLSLGNGRFLLAVCFRNKLHIYSHKHPSFQNVLHTANLEEKHLWSCIALAHSHHDVASFCWGPKASIVLVHNNHLSLFSSWLVRGANERITQKGVCSATDVHDKLPCTVHVNETIFGKFGLSENYSNTEATENNSMLLPGQHNSHCSNGLWSLLDISSNLSGPLAPYHPRALIHHLYSGVDYSNLFLMFFSGFYIRCTRPC
ncbi:hypothetical protein ACQJBY_027066 [Aegilops geniculata]